MRRPGVRTLVALCLGVALSAGAAEKRSSVPAGVAVPAPVRGLAPAPSAPKAPAAAEAVVAAQTAAAAQTLEALSPERAASVSGEQASDLAGKLIEPGAVVDPDTLLVMGLPSSGVEPLKAPEPAPSAAWAPPAPPKPAGLEAPASFRDRVSDRAHFTRLWAQNLWFYVVQNIVMKWAPYYGDWLKLKESGVPPPVSRPRDFFAHMRVMGQTGDFYIMGFVAREDEAVITEGIASFRKYFDSPAVGRRELEAFTAFVERARHYNAGKRSTTYFRKIIRDNMLKASVMRPENIAAFFDGLYAQAASAKAAQFQDQSAAQILRRFEAVVREELAAEPAGAKGRVRAVILIGSFAYGAATPTSDFDVELVTEGGSDVRLRAFVARVTDRWKAEGRQGKNPVTFHMFPYSPSRRLVRMTHDAPYLVFSLDPRLEAELAMREGEAPAFAPSRELGRLGRLKRDLQYAAVYLTSLLTK